MFMTYFLHVQDIINHQPFPSQMDCDLKPVLVYHLPLFTGRSLPFPHTFLCVTIHVNDDRCVSTSQRPQRGRYTQPVCIYEVLIAYRIIH